MKQNIIEAHHTGDIFLCPKCNKEKKYYSTGLCHTCVGHQQYYTNIKNREYRIRKAREQTKKGYSKRRHQMNKIGNMDSIEKLCLDYGFSKEVATAIAMDGIILDEEMKKRNMLLKD